MHLFSKILISLSLLFLGEAYAGEMSKHQDLAKSDFIPFVSLEATDTWNTIYSTKIFNDSPIVIKQPWGGRGAVGLLRLYPNQTGFTSEVGWGYYGKTRSTQSGVSANGILNLSIVNKSDLYGFDVLVGLFYRYKKIDWFVKAGAMALNRAYEGTTNRVNTYSTGSVNSSFVTMKNTQTNVYPEIKLGAIYSLVENLGFTVAYMHVFGNNALNSSIQGGVIDPYNSQNTSINTTISIRNPSLQSLTFGLVYSFN